MTDADDAEDDVLYRHFIAIATGEYQDPEFAALPVADEVEVFRGWLCAPELGGRAFADGRLPFQPTKGAVEAALVEPEPPWTPAHAVAVYITGHGFKDGGHWIALERTERTKPAQTALPTSMAVQWLAEHRLDHLLVIVDLCYAGAALGPLLEADLHWGRGWLMLASAGRRQKAGVGELAQAVRSFLATARASRIYNHGPYFSASEFIDAINELLRPAGQQLAPLQPDYPGTGRNLCLPNPAWKPEADAGPAVRPADLTAHWSPRARGVARDADPGWFFTGRPEAMRRVLDFAAGHPGTMLVTGRAGTGKSAVLARLVTLADGPFRARHETEVAAIAPALCPRLGAVDAAVPATGKLPIDVIDQICTAVRADRGTDAAGLPEVGDLLEAWWGWLRAHDRPVTVVVDSLDEAGDPRAVVGEVLARLDPPGGPRRVRLLVGIRSPGGEPAGTEPAKAVADETEALLGAERIRLDEPPFLEAGDVAAFARALLTRTPASPYQEADSELIDGVVERIADKAGASYLFARAAATSLAQRRQVVQPDDAAWLAALGDDVVGLVRADIEQAAQSPVDRERAVQLLRAVAFGHGAGLPWARVWADVATAISGNTTFGDVDIERLLASPLAGYLTTDREDGITAYRIADDTVREALRERWWRLIGSDTPEGDSAGVVEAWIAEALTPQRTRLRRSGTGLAPEYVRRHLVEHAAAGGVLNAETVPDWFLPQIDPARLRVVEPAADRLPLSPVIRRVAHRWDWDRPRFNAAALRMFSALRGDPLAPDAFDDDWAVPWASPAHDASEILGTEQPAAVAIAATDVGPGRIVAVTGGPGGLRVWDVAGGTRTGERVADVPGAVSAVAVVTPPDGRPVAVAVSESSETMWTVDLTSAQLRGRVMAADAGPVCALAAVVLPGGRTIAITGDRHGAVASWDVAAGVRIGEPSRLHAGPVNGIAVLSPHADGSDTDSINTDSNTDGPVWAITAGDDGAVRIWDAAAGAAVGDPIPGHDGSASAVSAAWVDGRALAVTGGRDGTVRVWDLTDRADRAGRSAPLRGHDGTVWAAATTTLHGGRVCAVTVADDQAVRIWDLAAHQLHDSSLTSPGRPVAALAIAGTPGADPILVTAGRDGTIRSWALPDRPDTDSAGTTGTAAVRERDRISSLALGELPDGGLFAVTGSDDIHATLWRLADGAHPELLLAGHTKPIAAVRTVVRPDGSSTVLTTAWDATLRLWNPVDGRQQGEPLQARGGPILAVDTVVTSDGRLLAIGGGVGASVHFWDLDEATLIAASSPADGWITAAAATTLPGGSAIALTGARDGSLRVWDAQRQQPLGDPVRAHRGGVRALATAVVNGQPVAVSCGDDSLVRIWNLPQLTPAGRALPGHEGQVAALCVGTLGDGRTVALTGGDDAAVRVWDLAARAPVGPELPTPTPVRALATVAGRPDLSIVMAGNGFLAMAGRRAAEQSAGIRKSRNQS